MSSESQVDIITILSSDLIAQIAENYFNKVMFKQGVEVVDLKPSGDSGYAFSLAFKPNKQKAVQKPELVTSADGVYSVARDSKGKFAKAQ